MAAGRWNTPGILGEKVVSDTAPSVPATPHLTSIQADARRGEVVMTLEKTTLDLLESLSAKMDAILEKISRVGKENLTNSEIELLIRASEAIRRRRR